MSFTFRPSLTLTELDPRQCRSTDDPPNLLLCSWQETFEQLTGKGVIHMKETGCWLKRILAPLTSEPEVSVSRTPDRHAFLKTSALSALLLEWLNTFAVCCFFYLKNKERLCEKTQARATLNSSPAIHKIFHYLWQMWVDFSHSGLNIIYDVYIFQL